MSKKKKFTRAAAAHDIIITIDNWLAAGTARRTFVDDGLVCPFVGGWQAKATDGGFGDHMRTMLHNVPWHAYDAGTLRAILILILDGMPDASLEQMWHLAESEFAALRGEQEGAA